MGLSRTAQREQRSDDLCRFPGNPTQSYRSRDPLRVAGEVAEWPPHTPEHIKAMEDGLERLKAQGIEAID